MLSLPSQFQDVLLREDHKKVLAATGSDEALKLYSEMRDAGKSPSISLFLGALKTCGARKDLRLGVKIHAEAAEQRYDRNIFVANTLVDMYAKCGCLEDARMVFDRIEHPTLVSWNAIVKAYAQGGQGEVALQLFASMQHEGFKPDARTFVAALNACTSLAVKEDGRTMEGRVVKVKSLEKGIAIHSEIVKAGFESNRFVASSLLDMYVKCGSLEDAQRCFHRTGLFSVTSWNIVVLGNAESGSAELALELFERMHREDVKPDDRTFVAALVACTNLAAKEVGRVVEGRVVKMVTLENGLAIHSELAKDRHDSNLYVGSALVDMYAQCGSMFDARRVFDRIPEPDVVLWTAVILGYVESGECEQALNLFTRLVNKGLKLDERTYVAALMACSRLAAGEERKQTKLLKWLETGTAIHALVLQGKLEKNMFVANTLLDMYAKCGCMAEARRVFDGMTNHTVVSWTAMISGYVESDSSELALLSFEFMQGEGLIPDAQAFIPVLMACTSLAAKEKGRTAVKLYALEKAFAIHSCVRNFCYESNLFVASALVDLYVKCGSLVDAQGVFHSMVQHNLISWNTMIMGLAESGDGDMALELFTNMVDEGCQPDGRTYVAALSACGSLATIEKLRNMECLEKGMKIHSEAAKAGHDRDLFVANTLVDMYAKCGSMPDARRVFDRIEQRSLVSWNAVINGYADNGESEAVLDIYAGMMQLTQVSPNALTYVPVLKACGNLVLLHAGKQIHGRICATALLESCEQLRISLMNFYGKCGRMVEARQVFDESGGRSSVAAWNSLISGYSQCGGTKQVFETFEGMREEGVGADEMTFLAVLSSCSHAGLVEEGKQCFELMSSVEFGLTPTVEHFNCVVDMLGRVNQLETALQVVDRMPIEPDLTMWKTLLSASIKWKNVAVGRLSFERLQGMESQDSASYVLMTSLLQDDVQQKFRAIK